MNPPATPAPATPTESQDQVALAARAREWASLTDAGLRLRCGEMTAAEIRLVRAVLNAIVGDRT